ncbi:hypothetical protein JCM3770_005556 [Rhodotorula araucariae]
MANDIPINPGTPSAGAPFRRASSSTASHRQGSSAPSYGPGTTPQAAGSSSASNAGMATLPPVVGPDGKVLQGNALVNAFKGGIRIETANGGERTSRACLACRKLKTRCDGAEEPPCKRCRAGGHECVFVESKRGKRPSKNKSTDSSLVDKFRMVEKTLSVVLDSIGAGEKPDPATLSQLQASLAEGLESTPEASGERDRRRPSTAGTGAASYSLPPHEGFRDGKSPSSSSDVPDLHGPSAGNGRAVKRARHDSATSVTYTGSPTLGGTLAISPHSASTAGAPNSAQLQHLTLPLGGPPLPPMGVSPTDYGGGNRHLHASPSHLHGSPSNLHASPSNPSPVSQPGATGTGLAMLADASLAAQIDGRSQLTGLDSSFNLSTVTNALQRNEDRLGAPLGEDDQGGRTPAVLSKGIVTPELAVELFTTFFDFAYIHLPLLDPAKHTAPWVCATSPFLFTVILAVASRFHEDPTLHNKIYEEAHRCFVECVSDGERSIESVQACCILTVWTYPPTGDSAAAGREERPKRAWLYGGAAVRMGLELNLFRPVPFVDAHLSKPGNAAKANPWISLPRDGPEAVSEQEVWDALNRERTWLMLFVIDRNMSAVMGRPYQIQEAKPYLLPLHPQCLPFDLGVIAHVELQTIIGQVMDTFRDRLYGLSCASDEMPSQVVMKLFNSRMDEWKARWCPVAGEPIANNLCFYFYASKIFLNTIPLHTMLRNGDAADDPDSVSSTISSAKSLLSLGHAYAELSVLRHCPDVNFLLMLYSSVFLVKVRVSNSRFSQLVDPVELEAQLLQLMRDCQEAAHGDPRHSAMTCFVIVHALGASWKALETGAGLARSRATSVRGDDDDAATGTGALGVSFGGVSAGGSGFDAHAPAPTTAPSSTGALPNVSLASGLPPSPAPLFVNHAGGPLAGTSTPGAINPFSNPFAASSATATPLAAYGSGGAGGARPGTLSGAQTPSAFIGSGMFDGAPQPLGPAGVAGALDGVEGVDHFLNDTHFFGSVLVGRGASGFFDWPEVASSLDPFATTSLNAGGDPFGFGTFSYHPGGGGTAAPTPGLATATQGDPLFAAMGGGGGGEGEERKPRV